jgi:hypothetical protein
MHSVCILGGFRRIGRENRILVKVDLIDLGCRETSRHYRLFFLAPDMPSRQATAALSPNMRSPAKQQDLQASGYNSEPHSAHARQGATDLVDPP